ncbi:hypothetical protein FSP39_007318 [Pinctada imbricata]|uniref:Uncharacterized protein n=1 Tax=Pinctada imbricata TaxID=66713 RepID=A0AA88XQG3_PINIB|nr:hypothetical protein FSP39_007318 [Pinctada imbricata]
MYVDDVVKQKRHKMSTKHEKRGSVFRRLFSRKSRRNNNSNENLKQDQLIKDINYLSNDVSATQKAVSVLQDHLRQQDGSYKYMKSQIRTLQEQNDHLQQENKELINRKHRLELDICRLEMKNERNGEISTQLNDCRAKLEEYEEKNSKLGKVIDKCNAVIAKQRDDFNSQERNVKSKVESMLASEQVQAEELESLQSKLSKIESEKISLCKLMKEKDMLNEGRLRAAWIKFTEVRMARDQLQSLLSQNIINVSPFLNEVLENPVKTNAETRLLQQEMQIYRRNKLIEILEEKLREYEPGFSVDEDRICSVYTDDTNSDAKFYSDECFSEKATVMSSDSQTSY